MNVAEHDSNAHSGIVITSKNLLDILAKSVSLGKKHDNPISFPPESCMVLLRSSFVLKR
jgi:hypothetical protein